MPDIFGLDVAGLEEDWIPLEAFVVIKVLDQDGDTTLVSRHTDGLLIWETIGMLETVKDDLLQDVNWRNSKGDFDE